MLKDNVSIIKYILNTSVCVFPNTAVEWLTLLLCIWKVTDFLILAQRPSNLAKGFGFYQSLGFDLIHMYFILGNKCFLPHLQFIIH
jgi:hypothetical protein